MEHFKSTLDPTQWPDWFTTAFSTPRGTNNSIYFHYGKLHLCTIRHGEREILPTHYVTFDDGELDLSLTEPIELDSIPEVFKSSPPPIEPELPRYESKHPPRKSARRKKKL